MNTTFAHRSGQDAYQRCPRRWFYAYAFNGIGLTKVRQNIPMTRGIYVHEGLAHILRGESIDQAIKLTLAAFDEECVKRGLEVGNGEDMPYVMAEQRALIEGMLYGWWKKRYPELIEKFIVLEVEKEEVWHYQFDEENELQWLAKADALLLEKDTGDLFIQSFKTTADWDSRKDASGNHDIQGLSELFAVEQRLRHWWTDMAPVTGDPIHHCDGPMLEWLSKQASPPKIQGIRMEHLLCGPRKEAKRGSGAKVQYCPLIRGYKKDGITPSLDEYAWRYSYTDSDGSERRLGKGWTPFNAWETNGGVRAWIDMLDRGRMVQPEIGDALDMQFVYPLPYYRQDGDVESWKRQMLAGERRKMEAFREIQHGTVDAWVGPLEATTEWLDVNFPQHRHSCDYPSSCEMLEICHSPGYADDPIGSGAYTYREGHHDAEIAKLVQIKAAM